MREEGELLKVLGGARRERTVAAAVGRGGTTGGTVGVRCREARGLCPPYSNALNPACGESVPNSEK